MPALLASLLSALLLGFIIELVLLIVLMHYLSVGAVVLWLVAAALAGGLLTFNSARRTWRGVGADVRAGRLPSSHTLDDFLLTLAGLLLLVPGVVSDVVGVLLLVPLVRPWLRKGLTVVLIKRLGPLAMMMPVFSGRPIVTMQGSTTHHASPQEHQNQWNKAARQNMVIEGEVIPNDSFANTSRQDLPKDD